MEGSEKSFKDSVKGGELFKGKMTRCTTAKSNLTKSLTSFENCVKDFIGSESPNTPLATKKRKARLVMEGMDKMELNGNFAGNNARIYCVRVRFIRRGL